jgi:hypothetical protein
MPYHLLRWLARRRTLSGSVRDTRMTPYLHTPQQAQLFDLSTLLLLTGLLLLVSLPGGCGESDDQADGSLSATSSESPRPVSMMEIVTPTPNALQTSGDGGAVEESPAGESTQGRAAGVYVVQPGDTLYGIATRLGLDLATLAEANGITDPASIQVGQALVIPSR